MPVQRIISLNGVTEGANCTDCFYKGNRQCSGHNGKTGFAELRYDQPNVGISPFMYFALELANRLPCIRGKGLSITALQNIFKQGTAPDRAIPGTKMANITHDIPEEKEFIVNP